jgi:hypothetical protein
MSEADVDRWMKEFASLDERRRPLPDPSTVWIKAKLLRDTAAADRAARPITQVQIAAYLVVAAGWAALLTWKWSALSAWFNNFTPAHIILGAAGGKAGASLSLTFFMGLIALASVTVMLAFHTILAEE